MTFYGEKKSVWYSTSTLYVPVQVRYEFTFFREGEYGVIKEYGTVRYGSKKQNNNKNNVTTAVTTVPSIALIVT